MAAPASIVEATRCAAARDALLDPREPWLEPLKRLERLAIGAACEITASALQEPARDRERA